MTNAELIAEIKAEIERQIKDPQEHCYGVSSINKLRELLDFLDTLESEKPIPNDLEEAANKFAVFYDQGTCDGIAQDCFIAGAKWQKEQMLKEAVEGTVHNFSSYKPHPTVLVDANGFNQGDKVRIIIVKEDEK